MSKLLIVRADDIELQVNLLHLRNGLPEQFDFWLTKVSERITVIIDDDTMTWRDIVAVNIVMLQVLPFLEKIKYAFYVISRTVLEYSKELCSRIR